MQWQTVWLLLWHAREGTYVGSTGCILAQLSSASDARKFTERVRMQRLAGLLI